MIFIYTVGYIFSRRCNLRSSATLKVQATWDREVTAIRITNAPVSHSACVLIWSEKTYVCAQARLLNRGLRYWPSISLWRPGPVWGARRAAYDRHPVSALPRSCGPAQTGGRCWSRGSRTRSQRRASADRPSGTGAACCTEGRGRGQWSIYSLELAHLTKHYVQREPL